MRVEPFFGYALSIKYLCILDYLAPTNRMLNSNRMSYMPIINLDVTASHLHYTGQKRGWGGGLLCSARPRMLVMCERLWIGLVIDMSPQR